MEPGNVQQILEQNHIHYGMINHPVAYTAQETAASAHIPGHELLKTVVVKMDGKLVMAVVPAPARVDLKKLAAICGARHAELAHESEFTHLFPDSERGAMPPFGNLYGMPVYLDSSVEHNEVVTFNAGSHGKLLQLHFSDFRNFVQPRICSFTF